MKKKMNRVIAVLFAAILFTTTIGSDVLTAVAAGEDDFIEVVEEADETFTDVEADEYVDVEDVVDSAEEVELENESAEEVVLEIESEEASEEETETSAEQSEVVDDELVIFPAFSAVEVVGGTTITIDAEEGTFPENTSVEVTEVSSSQVVNAVDEAAGEDVDVDAGDIIAFDISFYNEGEEIQPADGYAVNVSFSNDAITDNVEVFHMDSASSSEAVNLNNFDKADVESVEDGQVEISAEKFSLYIVLTDGTKVKDRNNREALTGTAQIYVFAEYDDNGAVNVKSRNYYKKTKDCNLTFTQDSNFSPAESKNAYEAEVKLTMSNDDISKYDCYYKQSNNRYYLVTDWKLYNNSNSNKYAIRAYYNQGNGREFADYVNNVDNKNYSSNFLWIPKDRIRIKILGKPEEPEGNSNALFYEQYGTGFYRSSNGTYAINEISISDIYSNVYLYSSYRFAGAYSEMNGQGTCYIDGNGKILASNTTFSENTTIYAYWVKKVYTINLNHDDGTADGLIDKIYVRYNDGFYYDYNATKKVEYVVVPEKEGYDFEGYYYSSNNSYSHSTDQKVIDAEGKILPGNSCIWNDDNYQIKQVKQGRIKAFYIEKQYVTLDANGGTYTGATKLYITDGKVTLPGDGFIAPNNKVFDGWNTKADGTGTPCAAGAEVQVGNKQTLYAQWKDTVATVTYMDGENVLSTANVDIGEKADLTFPTAKAGYRFDGWYIDAAFAIKANETNTVVSADGLTLYAKFTKLTLTVALADTVELDTDGFALVKQYTGSAIANSDYPVLVVTDQDGNEVVDASITYDKDNNIVDAGEYTVKATAEMDDYTSANCTFNVKVTKATNTLTVETTKGNVVDTILGLVFGGNDAEAKYNVSSIYGDVTVTGAVEDTVSASLENGVLTLTAGIIATTETVQITLTSEENENYVSDTTIIYVTVANGTINAVAPEVAKNLVYNGNEQTLITNGNNQGFTVEYSFDGDNWSSEIPTATNAGSYDIYYKVSADGYATESGEVTATIAKASYDDIKIKAYDRDYFKTSAKTVEVTSEKYIDDLNNIKILYSSNEDGNYTEAVPTAAGKYYAKAVIPDSEDGNYRETTSEIVSFKINPAIVRFYLKKADGKYIDCGYAEALKSDIIGMGGQLAEEYAAVKVLHNKADEKNDILTDDIANRFASEYIDTAKITEKLGDGVAFKVVKVINYEKNNNVGDLHVDFVPVNSATLSISKNSWTYGDEAATLTVLQGAKDYVEQTVSYEFKKVGDDSFISDTMPTTVGSYIVVAHLAANGDYPEITTKEVSFTITPKTLALKWTGDDTVTYDGLPHALTAKLDGIVGQDEVNVVYADDTTTVPSFINVKFNTTSKTVESYSISVNGITGADSANYLLSADNRDKTLTINPKAIKLTRWVVTQNSEEQSDMDSSTEGIQFFYNGKNYTIKAETEVVDLFASLGGATNYHKELSAKPYNYKTSGYVKDANNTKNYNYILDKEYTYSYSIVNKEFDTTPSFFGLGDTVTKTVNGKTVYFVKKNEKNYNQVSYKVTGDGVVSFKTVENDGVTRTDDWASTNSTQLAWFQNEHDRVVSIKYQVKDANGYISAPIEAFYFVDTQSPELTLTVGNSTFINFLQKATFGLFFKNQVSVKLEASDTGVGMDGGVAKLEYAYLENAVSDFANVEFSTGNQFIIDASSKGYIYARATDAVGNTIIVDADGVVVYTDAAAVTESVTFTRQAANDITFTVETNGNEVNGVKVGTFALKDNEYSVEYSQEDTTADITIANSVVKTLVVGQHTVEVFYKALGQVFVEDERNTAPATTIATINVVRMSNGISIGAFTEDAQVDVRDGIAPVAIIGTGAVTVTSSNNDVATAYIANGVLHVVPVSAGQATITVTSALDDDYEMATASVLASVGPAPAVSEMTPEQIAAVEAYRAYLAGLANQPATPAPVVRAAAANAANVNAANVNANAAANAEVAPVEEPVAIDDTQTPLAADTNTTIDEDDVPKAAEEPACYIHWILFLLTACYAIFSIGVYMNTKKKIENQDKE